MTDTPARPRKTTLSRPAPLWEASTWALISMRCFRPRRCRPELRGRSARPAWALPGGYGTSANNCAASMGTFTAPTRRGGRSSIRESCLTRCPLLRTGRASAASGWMCEVIGWATPTGSNEHLHGRTDTKSPMVYSSTVHVAGGEEGSIRHDDDGRPAPSGDSPVSERQWVRHDDQYEQAA